MDLNFIDNLYNKTIKKSGGAGGEKESETGTTGKSSTHPKNMLNKKTAHQNRARKHQSTKKPANGSTKRKFIAYDPANPNDYTPFLVKIEKMRKSDGELFSYLEIENPFGKDLI